MKDRYEVPLCSTCPYHLGILKTLVCPCSQCGADGFKLLEDFLRRVGVDSRA